METENVECEFGYCKVNIAIVSDRCTIVANGCAKCADCSFNYSHSQAEETHLNNSNHN